MLMHYAIANTTDLIWMYNEKGQILFVNNTLLKCLEYKRNDIYMMHIWEICQEISHDSWSSRWSEIKQKGRMIGEYTLTKHTKQTIKVEIADNYFVYYKKEYALGIIRNISNRVKLEQELIDKKNWLQLLLDQIPCIIHTFDKDGTHLYREGAGIKSTGVDSSFVVGKKIEEYDSLIFPKYRYNRYAIDNAIRGLQTSYELTTYNGLTFYIVFSPWYDVNNNIIGAISISLDVTQQRQAEKLNIAKEQRIRDLAQAYINAQDVEREWLTLEVHDMIIQPLSAAFKIIESIRVSDNIEKNQEYLNKVESAVKDTIKQARNIMKRIYPSTLKRFGLIRLMHEELDILSNEMPCKTIFENLFTEGDKELPYTTQTTLYRVFHEALLNIRKYSRAANVYVKIQRYQEQCYLEIFDDGVGFDLETVSQKAELSGIQGMKQRTEIMGGSFTIQSEINKGTKIWIAV
ncbi:MAG: hypothetical protein A9181_07185 [Dehalococcoides mccartyi]|nr:MAG: hypothetical protein A9181_07185 [Dehalococcoides mccartyi]OBW62557.1 MAG: hypothetical protein A9183_07650 [Dehalococcoides mccartyi]